MEEKTLARELAVIDNQIQALNLRRNLILSLLTASPSASPPQPVEVEAVNSHAYKKCADCGALVPGPNARGDCPACFAGPFEEAR